MTASCKLLGLDPETYLAEIIHVMPQWPRERYLEFCPREWPTTRARLDRVKLQRERGFVSIAPPLGTAEQQPSAD